MVSKLDYYIELCPKDKLEEYYINQNHLKEECLQYFGINMHGLNKLLKLYGLKKPKSKILELIKSTCLEKYGVEYPSQNPETIEKIKTSNSNKTQEEKAAIAEKVKETNLKRYGVSTYSQLQECKEKVISTNLKKFGVEHVSKTQRYKEKKEATCLERYGVKNYTNKEKANTTIKEKYGVESFGELCSQDFICDKRKNSFQQKYGVDYFTQSLFDSYSPEYKELYHDEGKSIEFLKTHSNLSIQDLMELFKCPFHSIANWIQNFHLGPYLKNDKSKFEKELIEFISSIIPLEDLKIRDRSYLGNGQEIDILILSKNLGIEFNGIYWHSDLYLDKRYHKNKSLLAKEKGIFLFHIWEDEWVSNKDNLKSQLLNLIIPIKELSDIQLFNLQVVEEDSRVTYNIEYQGKIAHSLTFKKYSQEEWGVSYPISKGETRLKDWETLVFKDFIQKFSPTLIKAKCNLNCQNSQAYEKIGMNLIGYQSDNFKFLLKNGKVISSNLGKKEEFKDRIISKIYRAGFLNYEWKR